MSKIQAATWTALGVAAAERYATGEGAPQIARSLGVSAPTILRALRKNGVQIRTNREAQTKHALNHEALDELTPEAAYWCGFLFADGSIGRRAGSTPEVALVISECDRGHIEKLRAFLGSDHAITAVAARASTFQGGVYTSKAACRFAVRSTQLAERLCNLGRYDGAVDDELAQSRDFWRGVVDGDGTVGVSCGAPFLKIVGSRRLLEQYVRFLGHVGDRRLHVHPHKTIYCVSTSGRTAERVTDRLYRGATTALDRKAVKAAGILAASITPEPRSEPKWQQGGSRRALINARGTMCVECMGDVVVVDGRVRREHEARCPIGARLVA